MFETLPATKVENLISLQFFEKPSIHFIQSTYTIYMKACHRFLTSNLPQKSNTASTPNFNANQIFPLLYSAKMKKEKKKKSFFMRDMNMNEVHFN